MHFADATKNRSDDVKQWDFKRKRDLDALMSYHKVEGLVNWHRWSSMDSDGVGGTSLWKHSFAFDDCCRETTTRCRGKRQTNQEIQV